MFALKVNVWKCLHWRWMFKNFALKVNVCKYLHWMWMFALKMFENVCAQLLNNSSSSLPPLHGSWGTEHQKMHWIVLFCNKEMPNNWKLQIYSVWTQAMHGLVQVIATLFCGVLLKKKEMFCIRWSFLATLSHNPQQTMQCTNLTSGKVSPPKKTFFWISFPNVFSH